MQRQFRHFVTLNLAAAILILIHLPQALASNSAPGIQPLDGVNVEAVQTYQNPKSSLIDFGLGIWPLNPYYNALRI